MFFHEDLDFYKNKKFRSLDYIVNLNNLESNLLVI